MALIRSIKFHVPILSDSGKLARKFMFDLRASSSKRTLQLYNEDGECLESWPYDKFVGNEDKTVTLDKNEQVIEGDQANGYFAALCTKHLDPSGKSNEIPDLVMDAVNLILTGAGL